MLTSKELRERAEALKGTHTISIQGSSGIKDDSYYGIVKTYSFNVSNDNLEITGKNTMEIWGEDEDDDGVEYLTGVSIAITPLWIID